LVGPTTIAIHDDGDVFWGTILLRLGRIHYDDYEKYLCRVGCDSFCESDLKDLIKSAARSGARVERHEFELFGDFLVIEFNRAVFRCSQLL